MSLVVDSLPTLLDDTFFPHAIFDDGERFFKDLSCIFFSRLVAELSVYRNSETLDLCILPHLNRLLVVALPRECHHLAKKVLFYVRPRVRMGEVRLAQTYLPRFRPAFGSTMYSSFRSMVALYRDQSRC